MSDSCAYCGITLNASDGGVREPDGKIRHEHCCLLWLRDRLDEVTADRDDLREGWPDTLVAGSLLVEAERERDACGAELADLQAAYQREIRARLEAERERDEARARLADYQETVKAV